MSKEYVFDRNEKEAVFLGEIRYVTLKCFLTNQSFFSLQEVKAVLIPLITSKKLSVQVIGSENPNSAQKTVMSDNKEMNLKYHEGESLIGNSTAWKKNLLAYPYVYVTK